MNVMVSGDSLNFMSFIDNTVKYQFIKHLHTTMNPDWKIYLAQHDAIIENDIVKSFGDMAAELEATAQGLVLCDLSRFSTIQVTGEDAQSFLQNLLSNDILEVSDSRAQLTSFNSAKGRMLTSMMIWREADSYILQLPQELSEPIRKKLGMYVLRSKVKISDVSSETITLGISGNAAQEILTEQFGEVPQISLGVSKFTDASCIRIGETRFQINTSVRDATSIWVSLERHAKPVGSICWDWLSIRAGIPMILPVTQEQFVPQMVNLDLIGGISFKKGCYPGQEIVARMQYLGKLKRRMYLAHIELTANDNPQAGDELFSADMEGQSSGLIVNVAPSPQGGFDALAVVQSSSQESQSIQWGSLQGPSLHFLPLPYSPQ